jgi:hypothetical protein
VDRQSTHISIIQGIDMKRRTFLSRIAMLAFAFVVMLLTFGASSNTASAQFTACGLGPTYTVDLTPLGGLACFPFKVKTSWGGGAVTWPPTGPYPGPGIWPENPPVLPGTALDFVDVEGTLIPPFPGQTTVPTPCGPVCVTLCKNPANGCLVIKVYPGPCPPVPLPCP